MKSSSRAPDPDPNIGKAAIMQAETGQEWLEFARDAFDVSTERQAEVDALTEQVTNLSIDTMQEQLDNAKADRARYEDVYRPIEDDFIERASERGTVEEQARVAADAKTDVEAAAADQREQQGRQMAALGIDPRSGRYAGIDRETSMNTALASAGAQNQARVAERDKGLALQADVANMGRGLPAQSASAAGLGLSAGSGAVGLNQGNQSLYNSSANIMNSGFSGAMQGYAGMGSTLNTQYANQIAAWEAEQSIAAQNAAGIGSALGGIAGIFMSNEDVKEDKAPIDEGVALEAVKDMDVEQWKYKDGVEDGGRHVGPYAGDFKEATGLGDGHSISAQDAIGITMKAVQDLDDKVERIADAVAAKRGQKKTGPPPGLGDGQAMGLAA